jgi:hypothetical protein
MRGQRQSFSLYDVVTLARASNHPTGRGEGMGPSGHSQVIHVIPLSMSVVLLQWGWAFLRVLPMSRPPPPKGNVSFRSITEVSGRRRWYKCTFEFLVSIWIRRLSLTYIPKFLGSCPTLDLNPGEVPGVHLLPQESLRTSATTGLDDHLSPGISSIKPLTDVVGIRAQGASCVPGRVPQLALS